MKKKTKTLILSVVITLILLLTFTVSYALFAYQETGTKNNQLIMGDIWMSYNESNGIDLSGAMPGDDYSEYFEFNIKGRNTYRDRDIYYDVVLSRGETPQDKTEENRIPDEYLNFKLVEVNGDSETIIFTDKSYSNITNKRIHVEIIPKNQTDEYNKTYRLYMIINDKLTLGNTSDAIMSTEDYQKAFASVKVNVTGDFEEKSMPKSFVASIKSKYGTDSGVVAINTDGDLYEGTGSIREYRYSGSEVNNYVFFDTNADGIKTDDEIWRIVGIFKDPVKDSNGEVILDGNGDITYEEKIKLVKNTSLASNILPSNYLINNVSYGIKDFEHQVHWNFGHGDDNDWTTAGLQYYLNTEYDESATPVNGYLSFINQKSRNLISPTIYYLGNVNYNTNSKVAFENERDETNILENNKPYLTSLVGLLYPSDLGYSASSEDWNVTLNNQFNTSWFNTFDDITFWYLSPALVTGDWASTAVCFGGRNGYISAEYASHDGSYFFSARVLPVIHLVPDATIIDASGTLEDPYVVVIE